MRSRSTRPFRLQGGAGALAVYLAGVGGTAAAPDLFASGKPLFDKYCSGCHDIGVGAGNGEGPKLNGIIGRPAGTIRNYDYSTANRRSAVVWTRRNFETFIADPQAAMPGTRMMVPGVGEAPERAAISAYVEGFEGNGTLKTKSRP